MRNRGLRPATAHFNAVSGYTGRTNPPSRFDISSMIAERTVARGWLAAGAFLLAAGVAWAQPVRFVRAEAEGDGTGLSWHDAWTDLQLALANVEGPTRVWVAVGRYEPGALRSATFRLVDGIELYGGFAGTENPDVFDMDDRDFAAHETVLDGDIGSPGAADNVFHVVTASGTGPTAVLDGFTITGGRADGMSSALKDVGGGMILVEGAPTIRHCVFIDNQGAHGGGMYSDNAAPTLINCMFFGNRAVACQSGGAGALGGGIYNVSNAQPLLINCLFSGNRTGCSLGGSGGAIFGGATLINCTLGGNLADTSGGALAGQGHRVSNCILWGNRTGPGEGQPAQIAGSATVAFSAVEGGFSGDGNIEDDPLFADPNGLDGLAGTADDDLNLQPGSPCIDAGDNTAMVGESEFDLAGRPRLIDDPNTTDTGNPIDSPPLVDMGSYEFQQPCQIDVTCDDGNLCHINRCDPTTGQCVHQDVDCDDGNVCSNDVCDPASGCVHVDDSAACNDGDACTTGDSCAGGVCVGGPRPDCDDGNLCTDDACDSASGCTHDANTDPCSDDDACTTNDICTNGLCVAGPPADCDDGDACSDDSCDSATGCAHYDRGADCDDGWFCNGLETCDPANGCQPGTPPACDDGVACTVDTCNVSTDACEHVASDALCDDGSFCTGLETCDPIAGCGVGADPCPGEICDEANDRCVSCVADSACDDGDACTVDRCEDGACTHTALPGCPDPGGGGGGGDLCPGDPEKTEPGDCGCGVPDVDSDVDGVPDCLDPCPVDPLKLHPGICGCGISEEDRDEDGTPNCTDGCPDDPDKTVEGVCGCGVADADADDDGTLDCKDECPNDALKVVPGVCGCDVKDEDSDGDSVPDCDDLCADSTAGELVGEDGCPLDPSAGQLLADQDVDGVGDNEDQCPDTPPGAEVSSDGCVVVDDEEEERVFRPGRPTCGVCGAFGAVVWIALLVGLARMRTRSSRAAKSLGNGHH